jgi:hypothetical protein
VRRFKNDEHAETSKLTFWFFTASATTTSLRGRTTWILPTARSTTTGVRAATAAEEGRRWSRHWLLRLSCRCLIVLLSKALPILTMLLLSGACLCCCAEEVSLSSRSCLCICSSSTFSTDVPRLHVLDVRQKSRLICSLLRFSKYCCTYDGNIDKGAFPTFLRRNTIYSQMFRSHRCFPQLIRIGIARKVIQVQWGVL